MRNFVLIAHLGRRECRLAFIAAICIAWTSSIYAETGQSADLQLKKAWAATHLGYLSADSANSERGGRPSALELLNELLQRTDLSAEQSVLAADLKLRVLDELGAWSRSENFLQNLPSQFADMGYFDRDNLVRIWTLRHQAEMGNWLTVQKALQTFTPSRSLPDKVLFDLELLRARALARNPERRHEGYRSIASLIASIDQRSLAPLEIDPYLARQDIVEIEYLADWPLAKEVLEILAGAAPDNELARRRWFELACPSIHPAMPVFLGVDRNELGALNPTRAALRESLSADPAKVRTRSSGLETLLAHQLQVEELFTSGRRAELLDYVAGLPESFEGVETSLWQAHRIAWETIALGVRFRWPDILKNETERTAAILRLPRRNNLLPLACLAAAQIRLHEARGLELLAEYLSVESTDPKMLRRALAEAMYEVPAETSKAFYEKLREYPDSASALAVRAVYGESKKGILNEHSPDEISEAALRDAARALDLCDRKASPLGLKLREFMAPSVSSAVAAVSGEQARETVVLNWDKPTSENPALASYSTILHESPSDIRPHAKSRGFARLVNLTEKDRLGPAASALKRQQNEEVAEALKQIPSDFHTDREFLAAKALLHEASERGPESLGLTAEEWAQTRVRLAEAQLCDPSSFEAGIKVLREIATNHNPENPSEATRRAHIILESFSGIRTKEGYAWGMQQMLTSWEHEVKPLRPLASRLAVPLLKAYNAGFTPDTVPESYLHPLQIARSLYESGDYSDSARIYTRVMTNSALSQNSEPYWIAESWRLLAWEREAMTLGGTQSNQGRELLAKIAEYAESRADEISDLENRAWMERHRDWAADQLDDVD